MINDVHEPSLYTKSCDDLAKIHLACFQKWENERNLRPKGKREGGGMEGESSFSPITAKFDPNNVSIERLFTHGTVITVPIAFWGVDVQTLCMEGGRTAVTANQRSAYHMTTD